MGGDHSCMGCGRLVGMPHAEECTYAVDPRALVRLEDTVDDPMRGVRPMASEAPAASARELAARLLDEAMEVSPRAAPNVAMVLATRAQAAAALAQAYELAALREELPRALLDALGDDSHLDKLVRGLRDVHEVLDKSIYPALAEGR